VPIRLGRIDVDDEERRQRQDEAQQRHAMAIHRVAGDRDRVGFWFAGSRRGQHSRLFPEESDGRGREGRGGTEILNVDVARHAND
jgi:hypothetical protein